MIDKIVNLIFRWDRLRTAIFLEVDWHNSITRIINDPEDMKTASAMWCETDGWRCWTIKENGNYYFHDLPEKSISDIIDIIYEDKEGII